MATAMPATTRDRRIARRAAATDGATERGRRMGRGRGVMDFPPIRTLRPSRSSRTESCSPLRLFALLDGRGGRGVRLGIGVGLLLVLLGRVLLLLPLVRLR